MLRMMYVLYFRRYKHSANVDTATSFNSSVAISGIVLVVIINVEIINCGYVWSSVEGSLCRIFTQVGVLIHGIIRKYRYPETH